MSDKSSDAIDAPISLRDQFAMFAIAALVHRYGMTDGGKVQTSGHAHMAYLIADAMIEARK